MSWHASYVAWLSVALNAANDSQESSNSWADALRGVLAPPLKSLLEPLDAWLNSLPAWSGPVCATGLFLTVTFWVLMLKREYVFLGAPDQAVWRDLRIWALLVTIPYVVIYWLL